MSERRSSSSYETDSASSSAKRASRDVGIVGQDLHLERFEPLGDHAADAPEPNDADRAAAQIDRLQLLALPEAGVGCFVRARNLAGDREQQRDGVLAGRVAVRARGIEHQHTGARGGVEIDIVDADAGAGDDTQVRVRRR